MPRPVIDLRGQRFGRLVVRDLALDQVIGRHARWVADCDCGGTRVSDSNHLRRGDTRSCGCMATERGHFLQENYARKHGSSRTSEYRSWQGMKNRCGNPNNRSFHNYGGRGIRVCDEWLHDFEAFMEHVGPKPSPLHSIDRIDNDGNYEPGNVRWATRAVQNANTRPRRRPK